jgi:hypothetical protein
MAQTMTMAMPCTLNALALHTLLEAKMMHTSAHPVLLLCCFAASLPAYLMPLTYLMLLSCLMMLLLLLPRPLIRGQTHQLLLVNAVQPTRITRAASDVGLPGIAHEKEGRLVLPISLGTHLVITKLPFQRRAK